MRRRIAILPPALALAPLLLLGCGGGTDAPASSNEGHSPGTEGARADPLWPIQLGEAESRPARFERVVLVTIDTLRPDHLSCYGYSRPTSPFLDGLARDGIRFTHAFSQISHTAPAHATLLTGLVPSVHGLVANGMRLSSRATTLADVFRCAGYATAAFYNVAFLGGVGDSFDRHEAAPNTGERVLARALRWLRDEREADRFFLWLHFYDPHHWNKRKLWPRQELADLEEDSPRTDEELYDEIAALHGFEDPSVAFWDREAAESNPKHSRASIVAQLRAYDAQILKADRLLMQFHTALEDLDLPGETLWIVTSDHGEGLGSHGYFGHTRELYNEQLRVPLIVFASDRSLGPKVLDATVQQIDFLPTLADLVGVPLIGLDRNTAGRSFWPLLNGEVLGTPAAVWSERCFLEGEASLRSLQNRQVKLLLHGDDSIDCFDLASDPLELAPFTPGNGPGPLRATVDELLRSFRNRRERVDARAAAARTTAGSDVRNEADAPPAEWLEELKDLGYVR